MTERTPPPLAVDPETRRAHQLDALAAVLPMGRRDRLAQLLTDDDVETVKHLARRGMGENTVRVLASDLAYLEAWAVRGDRRSPALAGGRGDPLEVRGSSSLESGETRGPAGSRGCARMWRRVFVRTGSCVARVRTRRRRSGGGCRAGHPAPLARDRGAIRLRCPAAGAAAGGQASVRPSHRKRRARLRATCCTRRSRHARRTVWPTRATSRS